MTFLELAQARFSVRKFTDKPVEKEKLDLILAAANLAPTAKNLQPHRIYILQSEQALAALSALTPMTTFPSLATSKGSIPNISDTA